MGALLAMAPAVLGAVSQAQAGKIAEIEAETDAAQMETATAAREADRKTDLARAIASQNSQAGASGIALSGSPLTIINEDISREQQASERDQLQSRLGVAATKSRGTQARQRGQNLATASLLKGAAQAAPLVTGGS